MITSLREGFHDRFNEIKTNEMSFKIVSMPWGIDVEKAPNHQLIELQTSTVLEHAFNKMSLLEFYSKCVTEEEFPELRKHALKILSLFATTYSCEQLISKMKNVRLG